MPVKRNTSEKDLLNYLLMLESIAGLVGVVVILLLTQCFLVHANISLFMFLALASLQGLCS